MRKRTPWTSAERDSFVEWHESVIAQYPDDVAEELRCGRQKFIAGVRIIQP